MDGEEEEAGYEEDTNSWANLQSDEQKSHKQGIESFDDKRQQNNQPTPLEEFKQQFSNITAIDQSLLGGYLLAGASAKPSEIPLIIRYQDAETLLGLKPLDKNASNES